MRFLVVMCALALSSVASGQVSVSADSAFRSERFDGDERVQVSLNIRPEVGYQVDAIIIFEGEDVLYSYYDDPWGWLGHGNADGYRWYFVNSDYEAPVTGNRQITVYVFQVDAEYQQGLTWIQGYTLAPPN